MRSRRKSRWTDEEFDRIVKKAIRRVPREIRQRLENVLITVKKRPTAEMLQDLDLLPDEEPLGLYWGVSLPERSLDSPPLYPDTIFLFQEPLEAICETVEDLEREIEITVAHEIAHALGIDEERLAELGYE
ncbi:MAG: metallopeptidase family protein [Deltaproteobacteria bacterium]|nr:metallopeptidase family protein [Deltaproteobacteria bacterium]